jgi:hypothetical protein
VKAQDEKAIMDWFLVVSNPNRGPPFVIWNELTNDLGACHLTAVWNRLLQHEHNIFGSNAVPRIIVGDCAIGLAAAVIMTHNNETPKQCLDRSYEELKKGVIL